MQPNINYAEVLDQIALETIGQTIPFLEIRKVAIAAMKEVENICTNKKSKIEYQFKLTNKEFDRHFNNVFTLLLLHFELEKNKIINRRRNQHISYIRTTFCYIIKKYYPNNYTHSKIAKLYGRNHATIISTVKNIEEALKGNNQLLLQYFENFEVYYLENITKF